MPQNTECSLGACNTAGRELIGVALKGGIDLGAGDHSKKNARENENDIGHIEPIVITKHSGLLRNS
jgi:hypothetical protein